MRSTRWRLALSEMELQTPIQSTPLTGIWRREAFTLGFALNFYLIVPVLL